MTSLNSVTNFRDFGGHATADGRIVARGKLFRSGHFNSVTADDIAKLEALGVAFVVDLRQPAEREQMPNKWVPALTLVSDDAALPPDPAAQKAVPGVGRTVMIAAYQRIPYDPRFIRLYGDLFRTLSERGGPMVVHCRQGKDRTGIACALLLELLGVRRETIFEDFLVSNDRIDRVARAKEIRADLEPVHGPVKDEELAQITGAYVEYLQASFDTIEATSGSVGAYLENVLGISQETQQALRAQLLERADR
jgi:protein-tyrosine phosphatase